MLERTKKPHTDKMVTLKVRVHPVNVERIKRFVESIEPETGQEGSIPADVFFEKYFPGESKNAACLRGARDREGITQKKLAELTGIPQRHISEMENDKRPIGKKNAKLLAQALNIDFRILL